MQNKTNINSVTFNSAEFTRWVNGRARNMPDDFHGIIQDTRRLKPGMLYVALRGENFDGHDFVEKALDAGAAAVLVDANWDVPGRLRSSAMIQAADTHRALLDAAQAWRRLSSAKIIAITGSAGKTTTKEIAAALLSAAGKVCCTEGNMNNAVGLPLSVLSMAADCDFGVFELGTSHPNEISLLAEVLQPDYGVITSVGSAHIENFGSVEEIAREKASLFSSIAPGGCVFINMQTLNYSLLRQISTAPVLTVSMHNTDADFFGQLLDVMQGRIRVTGGSLRKSIELQSGLPGEYNADNLLLAFAVANVAGIAGDVAVQALEDLSLPGMRWQRIERGRGVTIINDAYNANPESVKAALGLFKKMHCRGRRIVVLGDMLELGDFAVEMHRDVGVAVARMEPDLLLLVGGLASQHIAEGSVREGFSPKRVLCFDDAAAAGCALKERLEQDDTILLKASRGMALENMLEQI